MYQVYNETRLSFVSKEIWPNNDSTDALLAGQEPLRANLQKIVQKHSFIFEPLFKRDLGVKLLNSEQSLYFKNVVTRIVMISGFFGAINTKNTGMYQLAD